MSRIPLSSTKSRTEFPGAGHAETLRESARQYFRAAIISKTLSAVLHPSGYEATSHHDAHYEVILPGLAVRSGLGELGRNNILVADRFGSRVRIGAVATTMPLAHNSRIDLGVVRVCQICKKCALNCPARALSFESKIEVRGVHKWPTNGDRCYAYWRTVGTDCGVCMADCPFSHRDTFPQHRSTHGAAALVFDNMVYGKSWSTPAD